MRGKVKSMRVIDEVGRGWGLQHDSAHGGWKGWASCGRGGSLENIGSPAKKWADWSGATQRSAGARSVGPAGQAKR